MADQRRKRAFFGMGGKGARGSQQQGARESGGFGNVAVDLHAATGLREEAAMIPKQGRPARCNVAPVPGPLAFARAVGHKPRYHAGYAP
ncbi:hypothetical protein GCM10009079_24200 [Ralstonia mannitolilytica]